MVRVRGFRVRVRVRVKRVRVRVKRVRVRVRALVFLAGLGLQYFRLSTSNRKDMCM